MTGANKIPAALKENERADPSRIFVRLVATLTRHNPNLNRNLNLFGGLVSGLQRLISGLFRSNSGLQGAARGCKGLQRDKNIGGGVGSPLLILILILIVILIFPTARRPEEPD